MAGVIASKMGFYLAYIFVFTIAVILAANYTNTEIKFENKIEGVRDEVVVNRVIKCLSEEGDFGEINEAKLTQDNLKGCFGEKYSFEINLRKLEGLDKKLTVGNPSSLIQVSRYVLVDGKGAKLEVEYDVA